MKLQIDPIWIDDDGLMEVRISLAGNGREAWGEVYCYPELISTFGDGLRNFPREVTDEVKLEVGSLDPGHAHYLLLRAFVLNGVGHCAIEFTAQFAGDALAFSTVRFAVPAEAASLNEMGRRIVAWAASPSDALLLEGAGV